MTIFIDSTEARISSRLPQIEGAKVSDDLENLTGADLMISTLKLPITEKLLPRHISAGALLVQRKSGEDMIRSIGGRILHSLAKMRSTGAAQWQCVLLSTGFFIPNYKTGEVQVGRLIDAEGVPDIAWHTVKWSYQALATEIRRYHMRGGVYVPLTCNEEIVGWVQQAEADLIALRDDKVKQVWPDARDYPPDPPAPGDILQELRPVTDWRRAFAQLDGVGPVRANAMYHRIAKWLKEQRPASSGFKAEDWVPTMGHALVWATTEHPEKMRIPKVKGWGKGTRRKVREQFGLGEGMDLKYFLNSGGDDDN